MVNVPSAIRMLTAGSSCTLLSGASGWACTSDRALKTGIQSVDVSAILDVVSALRISRWSFGTAPSIRHIGPMADDFYQAFGLGSDAATLASMDVQVVALAAIQGLHAQLKEQRRQIEEQSRVIEELRDQMRTLRLSDSVSRQH